MKHSTINTKHGCLANLKSGSLYKANLIIFYIPLKKFFRASTRKIKNLIKNYQRKKCKSKNNNLPHAPFHSLSSNRNL